MHGIKDSAKAVAGWVTELDHESGYNFYVHLDSGETTWEKPEVLVKIEEEQLKIEEEKNYMQRQRRA